MLKAMCARAALGMIYLISVGACVTLPPNHQRVPQDPWESWNRGVYKFNDKLDRAIVKPVTKGYVRVFPSPIRTGVSNPAVGYFTYGPDDVASFDARFDNVRIRNFVFPEPVTAPGNAGDSGADPGS